MIEENKRPDFLDFFKDLEDPRIERRKLYPMDELLFTTICAVICGAEGWSDVEDFGKSQDKQELLKEYLPYENGFASDDTYRRFFRALKTEQLAECFREWMSGVVKGEHSQICIDGKTQRRTHDGDKDALHMVSAFASEARLVLAQTGKSNKGSELSGIRQILKWLDLRGTLVSIDALGCQRDIAQTITKEGGDYLLAVKDNQPTLYHDVKAHFENADAGETQKAEDTEIGHGRVEKRVCELSTDIKLLQLSHKWPGLQSIIKITGYRYIKDTESIFTRYYICSTVKSAEKMINHVRSHWSIENNLHWVLDMSFGEDYSRIRKENAPENMGIFRHIAVNMIKSAKRQRESIKRLRKMAGWDNAVFKRILNTLF